MKIGFKPTGQHSSVITLINDDGKKEVYDATDCYLLPEGKMVLELKDGRELWCTFPQVKP